MNWDNLSRHQDEITNPQPPGSGPISPFLDACATSPNKPPTTSKTSNSGSDTLRRPSNLPSPAISSSDDPQSPVIVESGENSDRLSVVLHEPPSTILTHIMTPTTSNSSDNNNNTTQNKLKQKLLKTSLNPTSSVVHWSYIFEKTKSYVAVTLLLKLTVIKQDENEIIIRATSVNEQDLDATTFTPSTPQTPASADKNLRLLLNDGIIVLQPLPLKQTKFTFTSQFSLATPVRSSFSSKLGTSIKVRKSIKNSIMNKQTPFPGLKSTLGFGGEGIDSNSLFREIAALFYEEFKQEDVVDERMKQDFIKQINMKEPPNMTNAERGLITSSLNIVSELSIAKRISGTVNDSVEKFFHRSSEDGKAWAMSVAKIDAPATTLFADLWCIDTYAYRKKHKDLSICNVWENLDGSRSIQYQRALSLPGGFKDRLFDSWVCWDGITNERTKRRTFVNASTSMDDYQGVTHHPAPEKLIRATWRGVYVVKELTDTTCEWTWAAQVDLKVPAMPTSMLDFLTKKELTWAGTVQEKYSRNRKKVDREKVDSLAKDMRRRRGEPLMEDQAPLFESCKQLLGDNNSDYGWRKLASPCPYIDMKIQYFPPQKGERTVARGKAVGIVDSPAEEVAAFVMDYCNHDRMQNSKEEGNPARIELRKKARENEASYATVKKMPFFIDNREFVVRIAWKVEEGKVLVAVESIDDEVDYGVKLKKVRALTRCLWQIEDLPVRGGAKQCRVTLFQIIDAGGSIPTWLVDNQMPQALLAIQSAMDAFRQDEKIDAAERLDLATFMRERWQDEVYSEEENALLQRIFEHLEGSFKGKSWKQLKSTDVFVKMESIYKDGTSLAIGRAFTVVDATIEDCASWEIARVTRERNKDHYDFGGLERFVEKLNSHCDLYYVAIDLRVPGLAPREWLTKCVWKMVDENTMIVGLEDTRDEHFPVGGRKRYVRASTNVFWKYERLPKENGVPQTRVTYCQQVDIKGFVPKFLINRKLVGALEYLSTMRRKFDQSLEIDARQRAEIVKNIKREELTGGAEALAQFEAISEEKHGWERPSSGFGMADSKVHADAIGGYCWGFTNVKVRAEMEEVAAFFWDFCSRANMEISGDVERTFEEDEEVAGGFKKVVERRQKFHSTHLAHHRNRVFTSEMKIVRVDSDTIIIVISPASIKEGQGRQRASSLSDHVDAKETVTIRLQRAGGEKTNLEYVCALTIGADTSHHARKAFVEMRLEELSNISIYFQRLIALVDCGSEDGQALAHDVLMHQTMSGKKRVERLKEVLQKNRALKEVVQEHPHLTEMLTVAVEGHLHMNKEVITKLECLSVTEATQIGKNLVPCLMTESLAEAGVEQWRVQNRAVKELMEEHEWFEPMVVVLGKGIVKTASWGLMFRVIVGAILSVTDLGTDLLMLKQFADGGEKTATVRDLQLASLVASIVLQLLIVLIQNRRKGVNKMTRESLVVLTGMKAPWDAYRVASGAEQEKDTEIDPLMEMVFSKCAELFAESIPGILIQLSAILGTLESAGGVVSITAYTSLAVSMLTTGFVSATISYDFDVDPHKRAFNPGFYGYVPDAAFGRILVLGTLMGISACQVLIKSLFLVVLGYTSALYSWCYLWADVAFYLVLKVFRGDFRHWVKIEGLAGLFISGIIRVVAKFLVDFTACVQYRHPYETGGLYFMFNLFSPLLSLTIFVCFFLEGTGAFSDSTMRYLSKVTLTSGAFLVLFSLLFFSTVGKKYRSTFFSVETGGQLTRRNFLEGNDVMKADVFTNNHVHWAPIESKVERWVMEGWAVWEEEKPEWFSDRWKELVPVYMILAKGEIGLGMGGEDGEDEVEEERRKTKSKKSKVEPEGGGAFDVEDFKRKMKRRGSING